MAPKRHQAKATKPGSRTSSEKTNQPQQRNAQAAAGETGPQPKRKAKADPKALEALLQQKALAGDLASAKLLVQMSDKKSKPTKPAAKKRQGLTCAQRLALEPPWEGDLNSDFPANNAAPFTEPSPIPQHQ